MTDLEIAQKMIAAMKSGDFEGLLTTLDDNVSMVTPMGPQKGKAAVGATLKMFAGMGAKPDTPIQDGPDIYARTNTPMGSARIFFTLNEGLIVSMETKMG
jgi:ketosteroid isomerase-like protein